MKNYAIFKLFLLLISQFYFSQGSVGIGTNSPNNSAALELNVSGLPANNKKGFLLPRVALQNNTDIITIPNPAVGLTVYNTVDSGSGGTAVRGNTFYYWNGTNWINLSNITEVRRELLPQVFFIAEPNNSITTPQNTVSGSDNVNTSPVSIDFSASSIILNTGNNITQLNENDFRINNSGDYEVSGFIGYNPSISPLTSETNLEFMIQLSTDNGASWSTITKVVGDWGYGTTLNNRTNNIPATVVTLNQNNLIRCVIFKTAGANHSSSATISAPTGLTYGKVFRIQKLD